MRRTYGETGRPAPLIEIRKPWREVARPEQLEPAGDWRIWLIDAGRGWGKTRTGAEWTAEMARKYPGCRIALTAATFADGRDTMIEGDSGMLSVLGRDEIKTYNRSTYSIVLTNGSRLRVFTSEKAKQLRGPQHHFAWGDEPAQWADASLGSRGGSDGSTFSNLNFGLRLPARPGWPSDYRARMCLTTTPKRVKLIKSRDEENPGLLQMDGVHLTAGHSDDNLANLDPAYRKAVIDPMRNTRLGRQELAAELLEDVPGALWSYELLERHRVAEIPETLSRVVVAIDPAVTAKAGSDETGIIVAGLAPGGHAYVWRDYSGRYSPSEWGKRALAAFDDEGADLIVAEVNNGGDLVKRNLQIERPYVAFKAVSASRGKATRAEPIATATENGRVHIVGALPELEEQLCSWVPGGDDTGESPDRLDAFVWAMTELIGRKAWGVVS